MVDTATELSPPPPQSEGVDPANRSYQHLSVKGPALVVLGIAVLIIVTGVVASALVSGTTPTLSIHHIAIAGGTNVPLTPAASALHSIVGAGEPPADILGNLAVPTGSRVESAINSDQSQTQFDRTVNLASGLSSDQVVAVYRALLPRLGWQILYVGAGARQGRQGIEVLAKHGSGDGFYWEVGAVVSPMTSTGTTPYSLELFELPDGN